MVERSEENASAVAVETIGDAAYGDGGTRQTFADAGRTLVAKLPRRGGTDLLPKEDFEIDWSPRAAPVLRGIRHGSCIGWVTV